MNVRLTLLLIVVLGLIGGSVGITLSLRTKEPEEKSPWMYKVNMNDISHISVTHTDRHAEYNRKGNQWVIEDGSDTPVFMQKWAGSTLLLSGPRSSRAILEEIDDPARYGLDSPQTKVQIVDRSGLLIDFHLGDPTPNGQNWYARVVGSERLFTVASIWGEVISKLASEPPYVPFKLNVDNLLGISVSHDEKQVDYAFQDERWMITDIEGNETPLLLEKWADATLLLSNPMSRQVPEEEISRDTEYGLDTPRTKVLMLDKGRDVVEFSLGNPTPGGGDLYAAVDGSPILYTVSASWAEVLSKLATDPPAQEEPSAG